VRHRTLSIALLLPIAAVAADLTLDQLLDVGRILDHASVIVVTTQTHAADMCRGFSLTESEIKIFFRKSAPLTPEQLHDRYQWSPCEVDGHILYQDQKLRFMVNAASTGEIQVAPGKYLYFGCPSACKDMFNYGYRLPPAPTTVPAPATSPHP